jgi:hypothetical protein
MFVKLSQKVYFCKDIQNLPGFVRLYQALPSLTKLYQAASEIGDGEKGEFEAVDQEVVRLQVTMAHAVAHQVTDS